MYTPARQHRMAYQYNDNYANWEAAQADLKTYVEETLDVLKKTDPLKSIDTLQPGDLLYMTRRIPRFGDEFDEDRRGSYGIVSTVTPDFGGTFVEYFPYGGDFLSLKDGWSDRWEIKKVEGVEQEMIEHIILTFFHRSAMKHHRRRSPPVDAKQGMSKARFLCDVHSKDQYGVPHTAAHPHLSLHVRCTCVARV